MIFHMTGGNWGYLTRRLFESGSRTIPLMLLLILPVLIGIPHLYIWSHADAVAKSHVLQHKAPISKYDRVPGPGLLLFRVCGSS